MSQTKRRGALRTGTVGSPRNDANLQPLDLLLSGGSSIVAVYAAAASLASDKNAQFFTWIVMVGTLCSMLLVWLFRNSTFSMADTTAYTLVALIAAFGISSLNDLAPEAIYVGPLSMAGVLSWMLALGSFTVWRDQTMLFQAVPAIALFGLVGCYDTFRASVIYFFVFLVCQAILLARAHGRVMLRQARSSGVEALEMSVMRKGPWRWMAGPEWALGSALTIVVISIISAPLLRESARGFSGLVRYTPPVSPLSNQALSNAAMGSARVGTGPNGLSQAPVLRVDIPEPMYLRGFAYGRYDQGAWAPRNIAQANLDPNNPRPFDVTAAITDRREITFRIEPLQINGTVVAVPGEVEELLGDSPNSYYRNVGSSYNIRGEAPYPPLEGRSVVFGGHATVSEAERNISKIVPEYAQIEGIPSDVAAFATQVTKGAKSDLEKAMAIKRAIERTAKYNLSAAATPAGEDPVSYFLFKSKEGYCDLFASSMTLMARSVGLPARYATGFYPFNSDKDERGRYLIRQKDAHAWCEIFFKNAGWVIFDATEGAEEVEGGRLGSANDRPFWQSSWFIMVSIFTGGSVAAYGFYFAIGAYSRYRNSPSYADRHVNRAAAKIRSQVRNQYVAFERELNRTVRRPRGVAETIPEYTDAAAVGLGTRAPLARETASAFAFALYAEGQVDAGTIEDLRARVKGFKQARRGKEA